MSDGSVGAAESQTGITEEQIDGAKSMGEMVGDVALIGGQIAAVIELASAPGKKAGQKLGQVST